MTNARAAEPSPLAAKLMQKPPLSPERMPALRAALAKVAKRLQDATGELIGTPAEFHFARIENVGSMADIGGIRDSVVGMLKGWDARILTTLDRTFTDALSEAAFGGEGLEAPLPADAPVSPTELALVKEFVGRVATVMQAAFTDLAPTQFEVLSIRARLDSDAIDAKPNPMFIARLEWKLLGRTGAFGIVVPHQALHPFRARFADEPASDILPPDPTWSRKMRDEVVRAAVSVQATLDGPSLTLGEIANLQPGQILELRSSVDGPVMLEAGKERLFECKLGQSRGMLTLMVTTEVTRKKETLSEAVLAGLPQ